MRWRDGTEIAEAEAWAAMGRKNPGFFIYRRLFGPAAIAAGLGAVGYGMYRGWTALSSRPADGHVPSLMWFLLIPLLAGSVLAAKGGGRARPFGTIVVLVLIVGAAWLLWLGTLVSMLA